MLNSWTPLDDKFSSEFQTIRSDIEELESNIRKGIKKEASAEGKKQENSSIKDWEVYQQLLSSYKMLSTINESLMKQNDALKSDKESKISSDDDAVKLLKDSLESEKIINKTLRSKLLYVKKDNRVPRLEAETTIYKRMILKVMNKLKKAQEKYSQAIDAINEKDKIIKSLSNDKKEEESIKPIIAGEDDESDVELDDSDSDDEAVDVPHDIDAIESFTDLNKQIEALAKENNDLRLHNLEIMNGRLQKTIEELMEEDLSKNAEEENVVLRQRLVTLERQKAQFNPQQQEKLNEMIEELSNIRNTCSQLNGKVEELEKENNELSSIKEQLNAAIKAKDELENKVKELQNKPEPVIPKQIDVIPIFEQMEILQKENNELRRKLNPENEEKADDELLGILDNHCKELRIEEVQNKTKEIEELSKKVNSLTRENQDLSIKVIALSDKTEDPDDGLVVVEDMDEQIPEPEKETLDEFSDDFVDEEVEEDATKDAAYWKAKYEEMKEKVEKLEHSSEPKESEKQDAEDESDFEDDFEAEEKKEEVKEENKEAEQPAEEKPKEEAKEEEGEKTPEAEIAELKAKVEEFEKKAVEQQQLEQYLIKRCNDAQMFIEQQEYEMDELRDKKKTYKQKLKDLQASLQKK